MNLKSKSLVLIALSSVCLLLAALFLYTEIKDEISYRLGSLFLKKQIQYSRERVLRPLMRELALARKLSKSPTLLAWAENEDDTVLKKEGLADLESYRLFFKDRSYFFAIAASRNYYYNNAENQFIGKQLRYQLNLDDSASRWFFASLESGKPYNLNVDFDEKLGCTKVWINVVLQNHQKRLGVVGTGITLTKFIKQAVSSSQPEITNMLIDQNGAIQAYKDISDIDFHTVANPIADQKTIFSLLPEEDKKLLKDALEKNRKSKEGECTIFFISMNNHHSLAALSYIKEIGWYTVSIIDTEKILDYSSFYNILLVIMILLILHGVVIYILLNQYIFRRITLLDNSVNNFFRENETMPPLDRKDEIDQLHFSFKGMVDKIQAYSEELKGQVAERTRDLEEAKKEILSAEEELQKVRILKNLGDLAGGIAHDFNNILTGILGNISLAKYDMDKNRRSFQFLEKSEQSVKRAAELTDKLLTFAKGGNPKTVKTRINEIINDTVSLGISGSNIKAEFDLDDDLWSVDIDINQMKQVFSALTMNAAEAMPKGGTLKISAENAELQGTETTKLPKGKYIKIVFQDTGKGIESDALKNIFAPYYSTKATGRGMGLSICHSIITKHGGDISAVPKDGEGGRIVIYLPTKEGEGDTSEKYHTPIKKSRELKQNFRVLVMDNEEVIVDFVKAILEQKSALVTGVYNGDELIEVYRSTIDKGENFDIIIMDLTIPGGMGGEEAVKKVLKINPDAKCIVASGYANNPVITNYAEYGFKGVIRKPFSVDELISTIARIIDKN